jgi:hypothetical protein
MVLGKFDASMIVVMDGVVIQNDVRPINKIDSH